MAADKLELMATTSNIVLPDTEKRLVRSRMSDTQRELEALDGEIAHLQSTRANKLMRIAELRAMISPIREIPGEIIAEIFSHLTSDTVTIEMPTDDLYMEPWNLSQVCSKWRGVALAMPQLWSNARIVYNLPRQRDLIILTQKLAVFFSRSGNSFLSLEVFAHAFHRQHDASMYKTITNILTPYYHRLQHISFEPASYMPKLFHLFSDRINSLESIEMRALSLKYSSESGTHFQFDFAPKLREFILSLDVPGVPALNNFVHLPWERLTKLHLVDGTMLSPGSGHELLRQCCNLFSCTFTIGPGDNEPTKRDEIVMDHLEVLEVAAGSESSNTGWFFRPLVAPLLKHFSLVAEDGMVDWSDDELALFVSRSSCEVEIFSITFAGEDVDKLLHAMPSVIHFSHSHYCGPEMLEEIGTGSLFPRLRTFICGGSSELNEMLMMLESRARKSTPNKVQHQYHEEILRTMESVTYTVMEDCWVDAKSLRWLERIMDEGLGFVFIDKRIKIPELS